MNKHKHPGDDGHDGAACCGHGHGCGDKVPLWVLALVSAVLLATGLAADYVWRWEFFSGWVRAVFYAAAYLPVGFPVLRQAWEGIRAGDVWTEFTLMGLATVCAFCIGEFPEGVAVMLFYSVGEHFQESAVNRAKRSIQALLDLRPDRARVRRDGQWVEVSPEEVRVGEVIQVRAGERVALDGNLSGGTAFFNTAALTGESVPREIGRGGKVLAGMISEGAVAEICVSGRFEDSALSRILELVRNAVKAKARPELFIRKFARIYTPAVTLLAAAVAFVPWFFVQDYVLREWLYRACVFLVVSCPCALVISIPLAYFGGIGVASRHGILFKGSTYLDLVTRLDMVALDKTGTLTKGVFQVTKISSAGLGEETLLGFAAALEQGSTHPVARAICAEAARRGVEFSREKAESVREIAGRGLAGRVGVREVLAGNAALMAEFGVEVPQTSERAGGTVVHLAVDGIWGGSLSLADAVREDAADAVARLGECGVRRILMLSGDSGLVARQVAAELGIGEAHGDLSPEGKADKIRELREGGGVVAFVGDGINDAPALAASDVGIAMGGLGSDAAIETADVIIQTDGPAKVATAVAIGRATRRVLWENISLAVLVKAAVLLLGAGGVATMWEAVFADVGVALLAILNAARLQRMRFPG